MLMPLNQICLARDANKTVAWREQQAISQLQFSNSVAYLSNVLVQNDKQRWALYCNDALHFAIAFFALLHAGKDIVLPGNLTPATKESLTAYSDDIICDESEAYFPKLQLTDAYNLPDAALFAGTVTIFTSGSTGEPKAIVKALAQFECELESLEQSFGELIAGADIIGTVSHQHIYGLLFRVLWPLATGRSFYSQQVLDNGLIHHAAIESTNKLAWIASPAHLKRLYDGLDWPKAANTISAIFSSGGPLPADAAEHVAALLGGAPIEVFGSSETGGIAFRQQANANALWQPLPGVSVKVDGEQRLSVCSSHINQDGSWYSTDDAAQLLEDGRFSLQGRLDRIVKLEEKRLSLVELEQAIIASGLVKEVYCWVLPANADRIRQTLTATLVLNNEGASCLAQGDRAILIKQFKQHLQQRFELSLIPRKWRFVEQLPVNAQAKIDRLAIERLMLDEAHT